MSPNQSQQSPVDAYIAQFPKPTQTLLAQLRALVATAAPDATEVISYGMPTFKLSGRVLIHYGAYDDHIGVYPAPVSVPALEHYRTGPGTFSFPLDKALPITHLRRLVTFQIHTIRARTAPTK